MRAASSPEELVQRIRALQSGLSPLHTFRLESRAGNDWRSAKPALHGYGTYGVDSILKDCPRRVLIEEWEFWSDAKDAIAQVRRLAPEVRIEIREPP